jgi:hypothetical protein
MSRAALRAIGAFASSRCGLWLVAMSFAAIVSCSTPDNTRIDPVGPPTKDFDAVVRMLDYRCGSLDCHGSSYRNLRIYGYGALRLDPSHSPETPPLPTQPEIDATYDAIVALEPNVMRDVVLAHGVGSERLTFVRKGRGDEDHKGGRLIVAGDDADTCIQSWLRGAVDVGACDRVSKQF